MMDEHRPTETQEAEKIPVLLSKLIETDQGEEYFSAWLQMIGLMIPGFVQGLVFISNQEKENAYAPVALWPPEGKEPDRIVEVTEKSIQDNCGLVVQLEDRSVSDLKYYAVSLPVKINKKNVCTVSVEFEVQKETQLKKMMETLQWSVSWPEVFFRRAIMESEDLKITRMKSALDLMATLQSKTKWKEAAVGFVTDLSVILNCDRVSVGFVKGHRVRIEAISNSASIGRKMNLVTAIEEAMHEAILMKKEIVYPLLKDEETPKITRMHEALSNQFEKGSILTLPFFYQGSYAGIITLERSKDTPFSQEDTDYCKGIEALVFPALLEKKANDKNILFKMMDSFFGQIGRLLGTRYIGKKLIVLILIATACFFYTWEGPYRLSANSILECKIKQIAAVPFNGYIEESSVRPGDTVEKGALLCRLDDRDLKLERMNYISQKAQFEKQYQSEMAKHNRAEAKIIQTRIDQASAQIDQITSKIKRTLILSPFKGIIVNGDLTRRLGGFVEQGESVFEIAPLDQYRLILKVDESRINDVKIDMAGSVVLFSMPKEKFEFKVTTITPISLAEEGINYFRVESTLTRLSGKMRPGMEGIGKIDINKDKYYKIWTRSFVDWIKIFAWKWFS